jgi:uncharacterized repeat protein (TIGR02543 family)
MTPHSKDVAMRALASERHKPLSILLITLAFIACVFSVAFTSQRASAATVVTVPSGTELDFSASKRTSVSAALGSAGAPDKAVNGWAYYTNVLTVGGVQIDAKITTLALTNATIDNYDNPGSASSNQTYFQINNTASTAGGKTVFQFEFFDHADNSPATLQNVKLTSIDLDSPGRQFTEFNAFNRYILNNPSNLSAYTTDQNGAALADGLVRFTPTRTTTPGSNSNIGADAVEVDFDSISSYQVVFGNELAQSGYFGVAFVGICDAVSSGCNVAAPVGSPQLPTYTLTYDGNSSSGGSAPSSQTGNGNTTTAINSGPLTRTGYTFAGWNTDPNGNGTHYAQGSTFLLSANSTLYAEWTPVSNSSTPASTPTSSGDSSLAVTGSPLGYYAGFAIGTITLGLMAVIAAGVYRRKN